MYYEINIALNGRHFFATDKRSITYIKDLQIKLKVMMEKFPKEEGYTISVSEHPEVSKGLDIQEILDYKQTNQGLGLYK